MSNDKSQHGVKIGVKAGDETRLRNQRRSGTPRSDVPAEFIGRAGAVDLYVAGGLEAISQIWRQFQTTAWYTPFQDIDWIVAWYQAAGQAAEHRPFIVLGYEEDDLRLILPLATYRSGGLDKLCWMAQTANDYNAPLIDVEFAARCDRAFVSTIWTVVLDACGPADLIDFAQQPDMIAYVANPFVAPGAIPSSCNAHLINLRPGWREFYAGLRGSKSRKRLREKENKLARLGDLQFRSEKDPVARRELIRRAIAWKSQQLGANGDRNPFASDTADPEAGSAIERTLLALCDAPSARHTLRLDSLYVGGKPVAVIIALVAGSDYSVFITAHAADETSKFSPGTTLLVKTLQLACRAGYSRYDLLAGDEAYKMDWCDQHVGLWDEVRGLSLKGKCAAPIMRLASQAKKALKQNPRAMGLVKKLNKRRSRRV